MNCTRNDESVIPFGTILSKVGPFQGPTFKESAVTASALNDGQVEKKNFKGEAGGGIRICDNFFCFHQ